VNVGLTGGAGFLGMHTVDALRTAAHEVTVVDTAPSPSWSERTGVRYARADVRDREALAAAFAGVDVIVHAAFASPRAARDEIASVNVGGTESVTRVATDAGVQRLVVVSSTIVTRTLASHPFLRTSPAARLAQYRHTRREAEAVALGAGDEIGVALVRPKTFLGPGRVAGFALVFDAIRRGGRFPVVGGGRARYQLLDVRDLATALALLVSSPAAGVFELGAVRFGTMAEDLGALADHAGTGARIRPLPRGAAKVALRSLELVGATPLAEWHQCAARGADSVVDPCRAIEELGWHPRRSNRELLVDAYDWYVGAARAGDDVPMTHPVPAAHRFLAKVVGGRH
jgi:nucleoside-diphosphate-sugar epimerase